MKTKLLLSLTLLANSALRLAGGPMPLSLGTAPLDFGQWQQLAGNAPIIRSSTSLFSLPHCTGSGQLNSYVYQPQSGFPLDGYLAYAYSIDLRGVTQDADVDYAAVFYLAVSAWGWNTFDYDQDNQLEDLFEFTPLAPGPLFVANFTGYSELWFLDIYVGALGALQPGGRTVEFGFISKSPPMSADAAVDAGVFYTDANGQTQSAGGPIPASAWVPSLPNIIFEELTLIKKSLKHFPLHLIAGADGHVREERRKTLVDLAQSALSSVQNSQTAEALTDLQTIAAMVDGDSDDWLICPAPLPVPQPPEPPGPPVHPPQPCAELFLLVQDAIAQLQASAGTGP